MSNSVFCIIIDSIANILDEIMNYVTRRFLRCAMVVFSWFVVPYSRVTTLWVPRKKLPPMTNPLLEIRAVKLAQMIRTKQVTSEEVVQAYIDRCREVNPLVNAIVEDRFDEALEEARTIDAEIAKGTKTDEEMERETPLLGLPVTVKESIAVKGMMNQGGRVFKQKRVAQYDAPCVSLVKKNGGIILLVSNTPELCMCWETYNNVSGQTRNPYDLTRTPGGSSGGEAALISSGASLIGLSSDIAGSARLPAMFTGIFGHKPTPYVISPKGHIPASNAEYWGDFFTIAPMTRYASDLPLLLKCVNDPNGRKLNLERPVDVKNIKFFFMNNDGPSGTTRRLSKDIKLTIDDVASYFNANKVKINGLKWALEISMSAMLRIKNVETIYYEGEDGEPRKHMGKETLKYFLGMSDSIFPSVLVGPLQQVMHWLPESRHRKLANIADNLKHQFHELLGTNGVFLYPTFPTTAHRHYQIYHKLVDTGYMMVFNTIGLPVTNCMVRLDRHKLPIGIQVVANPGQDHLALAVAQAIEEHFGGWVKPPHETQFDNDKLDGNS